MTEKKITKTESKTSYSNTKSNIAKKSVVKRRKGELKLSKASAVAISSQANRERKQALIEKMALSEMVQDKKHVSSSNTKVPLWVRIFFGVSLLLFCVAFYQAIIRPQLENNRIENYMVSDEYFSDGLSEDTVSYEIESTDVSDEEEENLGDASKSSEQLIQLYFSYLSNRRFDDAFQLFGSKTQSDENIREHFTFFRMAPFLDGIEGGKLEPINIHYIENVGGKDKYGFDLSYVLSSNNDRYEESWEVLIGESGGEEKMLSIVCVTHRCSYHPIFWPENFGLMK